MCDFISWIEYEGKEYFLTNAELETKAGLKLLSAEFKDDIFGHGAILAYYPELNGRGIKKECTDFSKQSNFPKAIAKAIKQGKLSKIGICLDVLNDKGKKQYKKVKAPALEQYEKVQTSAWEQYKKVVAPAWEQYKKVEAPALEQYEKVQTSAFNKIVKQSKYRNNNWKSEVA